MSEMKILDYPWEISMYQVNKDGYMFPWELFKVMQEAGASHHLIVRESLLKLYDRGYGWLLIGFGMEMLEYPKYEETITIRTWISEIANVYTRRQYIVLSQDYRPIGRAQTLWAFFDVKSRKVCKMPDELYATWPVYNKIVLDWDLKHIPRLSAAVNSTKIQTRFSDLDSLGHVNNLHYITWLYEALSPTWRNKQFKKIRARFMAEAYENNILEIRNSAESERMLHVIENLSTGKTCLLAETYW
jgi:acyl-ACP thioesterase